MLLILIKTIKRKEEKAKRLLIEARDNPKLYSVVKDIVEEIDRIQRDTNIDNSNNINLFVTVYEKTRLMQACEKKNHELINNIITNGAIPEQLYLLSTLTNRKGVSMQKNLDANVNEELKNIVPHIKTIAQYIAISPLIVGSKGTVHRTLENDLPVYNELANKKEELETLLLIHINSQDELIRLAAIPAVYMNVNSGVLSKEKAAELLIIALEKEQEKIKITEETYQIIRRKIDEFILVA